MLEKVSHWEKQRNLYMKIGRYLPLFYLKFACE